MFTSSGLVLTMIHKPTCAPKSLPKLFEALSEYDSIESKLMILNDYLLKYQDELSCVKRYNRHILQSNLLLTDAIKRLKLEIKRLNKVEEPQRERALIDTLVSKKGGFEQEPIADFMSPYAHQSTNPNQDKEQKTTINTTLQAEQESRLSIDRPLRLQDGQIGPKLGANNRFVTLRLPMLQNNRLMWTVELHERFEEALHYLGGYQVATPKKIRDYMKVEGLKINQVKSHLQKYRLHKKSCASTPGELGMHAMTSADACNSGIDCKDFLGPGAGGDSPVDGIGIEDLN